MRGIFLFIARRLFKAVIVLAAVVVLNFLLIHAAPGDPATASERRNRRQRSRARHHRIAGTD